MIVPDVSFSLPLGIWTLTSFFRALPAELEAAAQVDGCTPLQAFRRVILPLAVPGIFTTAILVFIGAWNEFMIANSMTQTPDAQPVTVAIAQFSGISQFDQPFGTQMAAGVVVTIPLVVLVLLFQRRIVSGLTAGGVEVSGLSVLMIGGSGIISAAVAHEVVALGHTLTLVNRGRSPQARCRAAAEAADRRCARCRCGAGALLEGAGFDVVVDWLAFDADDIERDIALFAGQGGPVRVHQLRIRAIRRRRASLPVRESTPLRNPFWEYSRNKIAAEDRLARGVPRARLPDDHRAPLAHVRRDDGAVRRRLDGRRPDAPG